MYLKSGNQIKSSEMLKWLNYRVTSVLDKKQN